MLSSLSKGCASWNGDVTLASDVKNLPVLEANSSHHRHGITVTPRAKTAPAPIYLGQDGHINMPKTFLTRKGALMLFTGPDTPDNSKEKTSYLKRKRKGQKEVIDLSLKLRTVERLSLSVLQFGDERYNREATSITDKENNLFFNFLHDLNPEVDDTDLHSQPGGDYKFYLRDLKRRANSRRHGYGEASPHRARSAELQEILDELEAAWPRPPNSYTAETFFSQPSSRSGEGFVEPTSPVPSSVTTARSRSLSQSGVLSSRKLLTSLKSLNYMGRSASTEPEDYASVTPIPIRSSSSLSYSRTQSAKAMWNTDITSPSSPPATRPKTSLGVSRVPQPPVDRKLLISPEHQEAEVENAGGTVWVDMSQPGDTSFEDFQSGVSITESDQMALDRQTQTPTSMRSHTPHRGDADSQAPFEELTSLAEEEAMEELMEVLSNDGDEEAAWPTQEEEQTGRKSTQSTRSRTPHQAAEDSLLEEDMDAGATQPLEPPYSGVMTSKESDVEGGTSSVMEFIQGGMDTERSESQAEDRPVSRTSTLTPKTMSRGTTPAAVAGAPEETDKESHVDEVPPKAVAALARAPSAQDMTTLSSSTHNKDPDTLVSMNKEEKASSTEPDKAALAMAAVAKMEAKFAPTETSDVKPEPPKPPAPVEEPKPAEETPRGPKRRAPVEKPKPSLLEDDEPKTNRAEDERREDAEREAHSERVKKELEEKEKKRQALKEEKERLEKLEREKEEQKKQAAEDKRKAAEERLRLKAEEAAKRKEEAKLKQQEEIKLTQEEEKKSPKPGKKGKGKAGKTGKEGKEGEGEKKFVKALDITSAQPGAPAAAAVDPNKNKGPPREPAPKVVEKEKPAEVPEHMKEIIGRKTSAQVQEELDNEIGKVHTAIDQALEGSVLSSSEMEGLSEEDFAAAQEALREKIRKAEEKIEEAVEGKKPQPAAEKILAPSPKASPMMARKGREVEKAKPGKDGKKSPLDKKKKKEEADKKKEAEREKEAIKEQQRLEKQRRLDEFRELQDKIKMKEEDRKKQELESKRKQEDLEEQMESIRQEEEEIERAEQDAREQLAAVRKAQREEREARRKADLEKKKQEAIVRREKEKAMIEEARKKEQEMLDKITDAEMARRLREEEDAKREEEEMMAQERFEAELKAAQQAAEEEEEKLRELERQAEEEAFQKLLEEKEAAEEKRWELEEQARLMREAEEKSRREMLEEEERLAEERRKHEAEEEARREQERERLRELQRMEEEAREKMRAELEKRRQLAMKRREHNLDARANLDAIRQSQGITEPWTFSYFVRWPKESYNRPMGQDPKKQKGPPKPKPPAPKAPPADAGPSASAVDVSMIPS